MSEQCAPEQFVHRLKAESGDIDGGKEKEADRTMFRNIKSAS